MSMPTVVTCRIKDYEALATRLNLAQAIVLQALSLEQIDQYLGSMGPRLAGLRAALQTDRTLRELAESPLMLSMMTLAYYRMPEQVACRWATARWGARCCLTCTWSAWCAIAVAKNCTNRRKRWAGWAGWRKRCPNSTRPSSFWRVAAELAAPRAAAAICGGLTQPTGGAVYAHWRTGGAAGAGHCRLARIAGGLGVGLLTGGLLAGFRLLLVWARVDWFRIETVETLNWRWLRGLLGGGLGAVGGVVLGSLLWLAGRSWDLSPAWILLLALLGFVSQFVAHAAEQDETKMRTTPGQGFVRSAQNGRLIGTITGVGTAVSLTLGWLISNALNWGLSWQPFLLFAVGATLYLGLSAGLAYGGLAAWQQRQLSQVLATSQLIPEDFLSFLDYAAERNLLRRVGAATCLCICCCWTIFGKTAVPRHHKKTGHGFNGWHG
ncbi:MAG: hypothetical protein H6654_00585 [Ardenticatenaceae bacterium]|nr:hypothetical protein [Ardenticatenaceae bacterium]